MSEPPTDSSRVWLTRLSLAAGMGLAIAAAAVTISLTAIAFWLSYEHLHDVAAGNGLAHSSARAWAWPAAVDLFIIVGELLILRASLRQAVDWPAIVLTAAGSLGSIALNVAGVGTHAHPMEYVVAAVPPVAALLAFGALMRQVHDALRTPHVPAPHPAPAEPDVPRVELQRAAAPPVSAPAHPPYPQLAPVPAAEQPRPVPGVQGVPVPEDPDEGELTPYGIGLAAEHFKDLLLAGKVPSIRAIKEGLGVGQARATELQAALKAGADKLREQVRA